MTVAVKLCVALAATDGLLGEMLTLMGGAAVIVIVAAENLVASATEVAVRVTVGVAGTAAGAVYVVDGELPVPLAGDTEPQVAGAQATPP